MNNYQKKILSLASWLSAICLSMAASAADMRVVGYVASFNDMMATLDRTDLSQLTHLNIAFANPDANGELIRNGVMTCMGNAHGQPVTVAEFSAVVSKAQAAGVKVLVSVAGGVIPGCSGDWAELLTPVKRDALIHNLLTLVDETGLDGLDIDIEGELLTRIDRAGHYVPFIAALSDALQPQGKLLTCATASYVGGMIPTASIPYFDFVNIMAYDAIGPSWGQSGDEHSTYAMAADHLALWKSLGLDKSKTVLGVPFYGYGFGTYASDYTFAQIVDQFGASAAEQDVIGTACAGCSYITYNGIPTLRAKTRLAMVEGSGVMIWELSQDATGAFNQLAVIHNEINSTPPAQSSSASSETSTSSETSASSRSAGVSSAAGSGGKSGGGSLFIGFLMLLVMLNKGGRKFRSSKHSYATPFQ